MAKPTAHVRLAREYDQLLKNPDGDFQATWDLDKDDMLVWYFVFKGATKTPYEGGVYMGKLLFKPNYPFSAPEVRMLTPNGRMMLDQQLCLSISSMHPEQWNPAWGVRGVILGLMSFIADPTDPLTYGGIRDISASERARLAKASHEWNARNPIYRAYFSEFGKQQEEPAKKQDEPAKKQESPEVEASPTKKAKPNEN